MPKEGEAMASTDHDVQEGFFKAVRRERPDRVPVVFCISSQYICRRFGVGVKDYLYDPATKLRVQCAFQDAYPQAMIVPGIYPDFGCGVVEPSAFGCRLVQREDNPLAPEPICPQTLHAQSGEGGIEAALKLDVPDIRKDGLMPQVLEHYRYFWKHLDRRYIDRYGYLEGFAFAVGPVETAALVAGYENFLMGLVDHPEAVHRLLSRATELTVSWLRAQEKINGTLQRIYLLDHTPARVGPAHFEEFVFPYLARVCREFSRAVKIYHICDHGIAHVLPRLPDMGIDVLYFGADMAEVKQQVGSRVCLMGNLSPIGHFLQGSPESVAVEAGRCIEIAAEEEGGYLLAPSGAFIPGTPDENIQAVFKAVE
jgi:uroporphyrinogen decarboxylase